VPPAGGCVHFSLHLARGKEKKKTDGAASMPAPSLSFLWWSSTDEERKRGMKGLVVDDFSTPHVWRDISRRKGEEKREKIRASAYSPLLNPSCVPASPGHV